MSTPPARSAVKFDLFADAARKRKIEALGDPLQLIARHIDFELLTQIIDDLLPRGDGRKGGRPSAFKDGDVMAARALMNEGKLPVRDVAKRMGVSVATLYRHVGKRGPADDAADAVGARG